MPKVSQVAKCSDVFLEIDGESLSARRVRKWKWQRQAGKRKYSKPLKTERITITQVSSAISRLINQVETLSQRIAKLERR